MRELNKGILRKIRKLLKEGHEITNGCMHTGSTKYFNLETGECLGTKENIHQCYKVDSMSISKEYFRVDDYYIGYEIVKGNFEEAYTFLETTYNKKLHNKIRGGCRSLINDYLEMQ